MIYEINHIWTAVHIWFISHIINIHFLSWEPTIDLPACRRLLFPLFPRATKEIGDVCTQANNWLVPNISGFIAQLVEHRTGIVRSLVQTLLKSWIFFRLLYELHKLHSLQWSFLHFQSIKWWPMKKILWSLSKFSQIIAQGNVSKYFLFGDHFINSHNLPLDCLLIWLGENWYWSLLGHKGFMQ